MLTEQHHFVVWRREQPAEFDEALHWTAAAAVHFARKGLPIRIKLSHDEALQLCADLASKAKTDSN